MSEPFRNLSVVGEKQDSGSVLVKPAYRIYPGGAALEKIDYGFLCVRVTCSGYISLGFVHDEIYLLLSLETLSVETDVVIMDVHLGAEFCHDLSVDGHHTGLDEGVGFAS